MRSDRTTTRRVILAGVGATGLTLLGVRSGSARQEERGVGARETIAQLNVSQPSVFINGPIPTLMREAVVGDAILVQVSYPISPPFPKSVKVGLSSRALRLVGVYRSAGEVAILTTEPVQGKLGVGYLGILVQAMNSGTETITARITLSDNSVKEVPFTFGIAAPETRNAGAIILDRG